ncbi:MAG TPA: potassium channel family protein [Candidatus Nanoarchaeia archaeon]|nr:potassium channel family protein [Candidatus Nanoarchaeia archaeon]
MNRLFRPIAILACFLAVLVSGSILFYMNIEGWQIIDAFYFTVTVITSLGHPDLIPSSSASKIFTSFLAFIGIGTVLTLVALVSTAYTEKTCRVK